MEHVPGHPPLHEDDGGAAPGDSARVVTGFDGRWQNQNLLRVAADEAVRRNATLIVVTVLRRPGGLAWNARPAEDDASAATLARRRLTEALDGLGGRYPGLDIRGVCLPEGSVGPGQFPLDRADLLVIGSRGQFDDRALHLESVSRKLFKAARCPVLAVPEPPHRPTRAPYVVAGVSDSPSDEAVIRVARAEAHRRDCRLSIVHVGERAGGLVGRLLTDPGVGDTGVSIQLTDGDVATQLVQHAAEAAVLVIGGRPGALSGLVRDSVSRQVLATAHCPVLAVPRDVAVPPEPPESARAEPVR